MKNSKNKRFYLFVFIVIFNVVARSKAKRFVFNVIASDVNQ